MKSLILTLAVLVLSETLVFAAGKNSGTVRFDQPVLVGTSTLPAGEYRVTWTDPGPDSKVTFSQGKKPVAIVPAAIVVKKNSVPYVKTRTEGSSQILQTLDFASASLNFNANVQSAK